MFKIEDFTFSSSSIDDFYTPKKPAPGSPNVSTRIKVASHSPSGFMKISKDTLVHISQQDFWKLAKDEETGEYYIERLADDVDGPIKG